MVWGCHRIGETGPLLLQALQEVERAKSVVEKAERDKQSAIIKHTGYLLGANGDEKMKIKEINKDREKRQILILTPQLYESAGGLLRLKLSLHSCSLAGSTSAMKVSIPIAFVLPDREHECNESFKLGRPPALSVLSTWRMLLVQVEATRSLGRFYDMKVEPDTLSWAVAMPRRGSAAVDKNPMAFFAANVAALASRKSSPRVNNEAVQKAAALRGSDHRRATNVSARLDAQQNKLNLPILPTTTIGSFPQTIELRRSSPRVNNEAVQNLLSISRIVHLIRGRKCNSERVILLDTQHVYSLSILADMIRLDGSSTISVLGGGESLPAELTHELMSIQNVIDGAFKKKLLRDTSYRGPKQAGVVDIFSQLQNPSEAFQTYVRDVLAQMEKNATAGRMPSSVPMPKLPPSALNLPPPPPSYAEDERTHIVQRAIGQAVGDMRMMSLNLAPTASFALLLDDDGTMIVVIMGSTLNKLSISPTGFPLQFLFSSPKIKKTSASIWNLELSTSTGGYLEAEVKVQVGKCTDHGGKKRITDQQSQKANSRPLKNESTSN
ncbi:5-methyltetrahydropteroyltriglutamate--homocysteine methyltransferase [Tanacetum coccineum]